jgi:hypothetical protein
MFTWKFPVLQSEVKHFLQRRVSVLGKKRDEFTIQNVHLSSLFNGTFSIEEVYDRRALPTPIVKRLLTAIRKITFLLLIMDHVNNITDSLIHPSLGVTVRSWTAKHETESSMAHDLKSQYNESAYKQAIQQAIAKHNLKSVLIAFDNNDLIGNYAEFLNALVGVDVFYFTHLQNSEHNLNDLQKAAVEMLALSKTSVLLGEKRSTFMECIYWFGECRQTVYHPV